MAEEKEARDKDFSDFQSPHEASVERLVQALDRAYHRPGLLLWRSFWQGVFTALGAFVGSIAIIGLSSYLFHIYGGFERFVQPGLDKLQKNVLQTQSNAIQGVIGNNQPYQDSSQKSSSN